jgi:flagellar basal body L-ring protein FlgH
MQEDRAATSSATWPRGRTCRSATPGAIYAQGTEVSLWQNVTARNVGDTLTIRAAGEHQRREDGEHHANKSSRRILGPTVIAGRPVT